MLEEEVAEGEGGEEAGEREEVGEGEGGFFVRVGAVEAVGR